MKVVNEYYPVSGKPIIFAPNHSSPCDAPIALKASRRRSQVLIGKQRYYLIDCLFFILNGAIWIDRKEKSNINRCKRKITSYLRQGQSILWFPEGTWNLTPSQLVLPLKWGIIDVAKQADAQIVPMGLDYDTTNNVCSVKFGAPISGKELEDKSEAIGKLRDAMATLRWDLLSARHAISREEFTPEALKVAEEKAIAEYQCH